MINRRRIEIDKIYNKIDKIAKVGSDNFLEYYIYIDSLIKKGQYNTLLECLDIKYKFDSNFKTLDEVKRQSWQTVLFSTLTPFQDSKKKLLKDKKVYQNQLNYYNDVQRTYIKVEDTTGSGAELEPIIVGGGVSNVKVIRTGSGYSASASVVIVGGIGTASGTASIIGGRITKVTIGQTGSFHNTLVNLGKITETDEYKDGAENYFSEDLFRKLTKSKTTYLTATKNGATQSATFSAWNYTYNYDKNLLNLYSSAINYLIN